MGRSGAREKFSIITYDLSVDVTQHLGLTKFLLGGTHIFYLFLFLSIVSYQMIIIYE